ncbi:UNVERIFIED_CONTAM: Retrovirus-related Pol polyprotein from transposon TNT 1-94 [Sesamum calycinum]|uniref:Retrovirus-related Pol polyprotein from transposon TNT 1-94 n=1 Tax=Sesamum calycinum TaxID=2727403 RepID=A0AAW2J0Z6_9LAMI
MTKKPFVGQRVLANGLLDLIHTDIYGPLNTLARGGFSYFITFTDYHSQYGYVYLIMYKFEAFGSVGKRRNRTLLDMVRSMMSFTELPLSFLGYALETAAKLLNMGHPRWYPRRHTRYGMASQRPTIFLEKGFSVDNRQDGVLLEESSEPPQQNNTTSFEPSVPTDGVPILCRSTRVSRPLERYRFMRFTSQLNNDLKTYREASRTSIRDANGSYKCKLGTYGEVTAVKARLVAKGYTQRPEIDFEETYSPVAMAKSIWILLAIAAWDRSRRILGLTQSSYIEKVLKKFKMENSNQGFLPMRHGIKLSKKESPKPDEELKRILDILYASVVESIQYVVPCTRPDVAYALSVTSRYQACPRVAH